MYSFAVLLHVHKSFLERIERSKCSREDDFGTDVRDLFHAGDALVFPEVGYQIHAAGGHGRMGRTISVVRRRQQWTSSMDALCRHHSAWGLLRLLLCHRTNLCGSQGPG